MVRAHATLTYQAQEVQAELKRSQRARPLVLLSSCLRARNKTNQGARRRPYPLRTVTETVSSPALLGLLLGTVGITMRMTWTPSEENTFLARTRRDLWQGCLVWALKTVIILLQAMLKTYLKMKTVQF